MKGVERNTHTHTELPGMLQPGGLRYISSPLNYELHSTDERCWGKQCVAPVGQSSIR